jgi:catechol 2,3-dioxygenase-like lactoylglutathione lyase family enzyme
MEGLIKTNTIIQVGLIVRNVEKTKQKWATFFGVPVPATVDAGDYKVTQTKYKGKGAPKAKCQMAFFDAGPNMQLELIQPNDEKSTWRNFLDKHGEGIHHIAFKVDGTDKVLKVCEEAGIKCVQQGKYGDASGEYAYLDTAKDLKCIIELLESYNK